MLDKINDIAGRLANMDRFSQTRLINPESVLEHTGYVCFFSAVVAQQLISLGEPDINLSSIMMKSALHDVEEVETGDIPNPTKYANKAITEALYGVSEDAAKMIFEKLDTSGILFDYWTEAKDGKSGFIVKLADRMAIVYKAHQEIELFGNNTLKGHIVKLLPALENLFIRIEKFEKVESKIFLRDLIFEGIEICESLK